MKKRKILLVEDEPSFGSVMESYLKLSNFDVVWAKNGLEGLRMFKDYSFNLCILDVMMPKMDGYTLAEHIKKLNKNIPILFLTAKNMKEDIVKGYELGAIDFISKPFDSEVLLYKIKAILDNTGTKKAKQDLEEEIQIGTFTLKISRRELIHPLGETKTLSPKEMKLLLLLYRYTNVLLSREEALMEIWGKNDYFTGRSMDVYITKLRKYLKNDPEIQITNIHAEGFIFQVG